MPKNPIEIAAQRLRQSHVASSSEIRGCTDEQIANLESRAHVRLPSTYRSFLSLMGGGAGKFLIGTDWTLSQLRDVKAEAEQLLTECKPETTVLSSTTFVFAVHQGYQFLFFDTVGNDDPPVFLFIEGEPSARRVFGSFSEWLLQCVDDEIEACRTNPENCP